MSFSNYDIIRLRVGARNDEKSMFTNEGDVTHEQSIQSVSRMGR